MSPEGSSRIKDQKYQTRIKNGQVCLIVIKIGQLGSSLIKLEGQKNKFFKSEKEVSTWRRISLLKRGES